MNRPAVWAMLVLIPGTVLGMHLGAVLFDRGYLNVAELTFAVIWCAALAAAGVYWFYYGFSRARQVRDMATSRIASAPQGYVEVHGEAIQLAAVLPLSETQGRVADTRFGAVDAAAKAIADEAFAIRDETGCAIVLPDGADVEATLDPLRRLIPSPYSRDVAHSGHKIYVVGELVSSEPSFDLERAVADILLRWRQDSDQLRERLDSDKDGRIDGREALNLRMMAIQEAIAANHSASGQHHSMHVIRRPLDGRPFVISTRSRRSLAQRMFMVQLGGVLAFVAGTVALVNMAHLLILRF